jgi:hypothetical protein
MGTESLSNGGRVLDPAAGTGKLTEVPGPTCLGPKGHKHL